jgi:hypothetical protein
MSFPSSSFAVTSFQVIRNLFTRAPPNQIRLGRWGVNTMNKSGLIADYSNEDHCGTCAQYITQKRPTYDVGVIEENLIYEFESISTNIPTIKKSTHANK